MGEAETLTFDRWQERANVWVRRNFPTSGASEQFLGIVEEIGEFATAVADRCNAMLVRDEDAKAEALLAIADAIGDISIYLVNYCNFRDIELSYWVNQAALGSGSISGFQSLVFCDREPTIRGHAAQDLVIWLGRLAHAQLKARQGIRGTEDEHRTTEINAVVEMFVALAHTCNDFSFDLADIIAKTSDHVFARDWIANPTNGAAPCPDHT